MNTFDSTKLSLKSILDDIRVGKIQLPDFQRSWVWDNDHIRDILASVASSFPVGAVMLLENGGEVQFQTRPVEGVESLVNQGENPELLILDGQQRLTALTQALFVDSPVKTKTSKGKKVERHYYFDIKTALDSPHDLESAIVAVDANKQRRANFNRDVLLDLSSCEKECERLHFPCDQTMNSDKWEMTLNRVVPENFDPYMEFRDKVLGAFRSYHLPVIKLSKETPKKAVCLIFEKVNTGGVQLDVFELVTASYAAEGYNLRDDWIGSEDRAVESRRARISEDALLKGTEATEFLQAVTLLHTKERKAHDIREGKTGKQVRPVSAKRADVLDLPLAAWEEFADRVERGFKLAGQFLKKQSFYARKEIPYRTQIIPLAAVLSRLEDRWLEPKIYGKLSRWFWCGILGELYGGAVETRIANDYEQLLGWLENDESQPRTVFDANFQSDRFYTLRTRQSAAYKGINTLVLREGAKDWFWKAGIQELDINEMSLDIHHIFPEKWCRSQRTPIEPGLYNCILNKTPLSYKANRKIGGDAPSVYLERIQGEPTVQLNDDEMNELLISHAAGPAFMRANDFEGFISDRNKRLCKLIERAMGKPVSEATEDFAGAE